MQNWLDLVLIADYVISCTTLEQLVKRYEGIVLPLVERCAGQDDLKALDLEDGMVYSNC